MWIPRGIVIPWLTGEAVNIRRPIRDRKLKYMMLRGSRRGLYPGRGSIPRGRPLLLVEGEFEALLLNQELLGLASAVTLGSAGDRPDPELLDAMATASPWIVAGDSDDAGRKSAEGWLGGLGPVPPRRSPRAVQGLDRGPPGRSQSPPLVAATSWRGWRAPAVHLGGAERLALGAGS